MLQHSVEQLCVVYCFVAELLLLLDASISHFQLTGADLAGQNVSTEMLQSLVESLCRRVEAVIAAKEAQFHVDANGYGMSLKLVVGCSHTFGQIKK